MPDRELPLSSNLEQPLLEVEGCLERLGAALIGGETSPIEPSAIEQHAEHLHAALREAVEAFRSAASQGQIPASLRHRLVLAGGQMAAQRTALSRANVSLDRAIDVLMPAEMGDLYGASGKSDRRYFPGGSIQA
ncbi:hypothetical protein ACFJGW_13335 [Burkholderiaceae bacterium UC74_6]